ncbi:hypothetical protein IMZ48_11635 [Candidatus Bathyarchaeota archaeon]|nr:hypothetical protein [Candidatus Bathyarchaeota archaeon]
MVDGDGRVSVEFPYIERIYTVRLYSLIVISGGFRLRKLLRVYIAKDRDEEAALEVRVRVRVNLDMLAILRGKLGAFRLKALIDLELKRACSR